MDNAHITLEGIGKVIYSSHDFWYDLDRVRQEAIENKEEIKSRVLKFLDSVPEHGVDFLCCKLPVFQDLFSLEDLVALERSGINVMAYSKTYPLGKYALNLFSSRLRTINPEQPEEDVYIRVSNISGGNFSVYTQKQSSIDFELIKDKFQNINTTTQVIAICRKTGVNEYTWYPPVLLPDGNHSQPPLTTTDQYAQSCFEGMVAMPDDKGDAVVLRPWDNAERLFSSCKSIAIPPLEKEVFMQSIKMAIRGNKDFFPKAGTNNKLYLRPYVKGLQGGYGVGPAEAYAFCIQVFPFGEFVGKRESDNHLIVLEGKRRSHLGGMGSVKVSGNYAQTILDREKAKQGLFKEHPGKKFTDTLYFGEFRYKITVGEDEIIGVKEVVDEDSAGNVFFFNLKEDGSATIYSPPLDRMAFLGGYTRRTVIELAKSLGFEVIEEELTADSIKNKDGAFLSGSAVGISKIKSITYGKETFTYYNTKEAEEIYFYLFDKFYNLRKNRKGEYPADMERLVSEISVV